MERLMPMRLRRVQRDLNRCAPILSEYADV
jgi:hypothetical protein